MRTSVCPKECTDVEHVSRCPAYQAEAAQTGLAKWTPATTEEWDAKSRVLFALGVLYAAAGKLPEL